MKGHDTMGNIRDDYELAVSPDGAVYGTKKLLKINGRNLEVSIPAGVKTGTIVKLRNARNYGDMLLIRIRIEIEGEATEGEVHRVTPVRLTRTKPRIPTWGKWAIGSAGVFSVISLLVMLSNTNPASTPLSVSPPLPQLAPVRLPPGTYLVNNLIGGLGELRIENGLDLDAVVALSHPEQPNIALMAVYIQGGTSHTIKGIRDSTYVVYFEIGEDWDYGSHKFMRKRAYQRFEDNLNFQTISRRYTTWELSLQPVPGGTASTEHISEDEFPVIVPSY